jgi:hypothetical protein
MRPALGRQGKNHRLLSGILHHRQRRGRLPDRVRLLGDAEIYLIDQRQVVVAFGVLDFIDADRVDLAQRPVFEAQVTTCSTASNAFSQTSAKGRGGFLPGMRWNIAIEGAWTGY